MCFIQSQEFISFQSGRAEPKRAFSEGVTLLRIKAGSPRFKKQQANWAWPDSVDMPYHLNCGWIRQRVAQQFKRQLTASSDARECTISRVTVRMPVEFSVKPLFFSGFVFMG